LFQEQRFQVQSARGLLEPLPERRDLLLELRSIASIEVRGT
jgi:hypothetical protein